MCGIAGVSIEDQTLIERMTRALIHRGPDDFGYFTDDQVSLGHRRLSIIDLSSKGRQPLSNEQQTSFLVFNGEIYNFRELRIDLKNNGHEFQSNTDAEVIIHLFEEEDTNSFSKLRGQFALAIYDGKKLILARDRLGIKPLYYSLINDNLVFASEIKAILEYDEVIRKINFDAFRDFMHHRYVSGNHTMFSGIYRVPPGSYLIYKDKSITIKDYWRLENKPNNQKKLFDVEIFSNAIREHLKRSVQRRLVSDVPLGVFLSGGLDSSAIVAIANQFLDETNTFSIRFSFEEEDESAYSRFVAEHFNTNHKEISIDIDAVKILPNVIFHLDEPLADPACIPTFLMSQETQKFVKVILSGEGGDELFAGYSKYQPLYYSRYFRIPRLISRFLPKNSRILNLLKHSNNPLWAYDRLIEVFNEKELREFMLVNLPETNKFLKPIYRKIKELDKSNSLDYLNTILLRDIITWLPNDLLLKNDKMTMASSIEARVPFLDKDMVELSMMIPQRYKIRWGNEKYILKKALRGIVPSSILKRRKHGFNVPVSSWMSKGLKTKAIELLEESSHGLYDKKKILQQITRMSGSIFQKRKFWNLFTFEIWWKIFMSNEKVNTIKQVEKVLQF